MPVLRAADSPPFGLPHDLDPIAERRQHFRRVIGRSVVDHDDTTKRNRLGQDAMNRVGHPGRAVEHGDDDGDGGRRHVADLRSRY